MEWNKRMTLDLIELYKSKSVLWNPENKLYKNPGKRNEAVLEISCTLGISKEEVDRKIKNLQGQFSREMKRICETPKCDDGTAGYESRWFAFEALQFLKERKNIRCRRTANTVQEGNGGNLIEFSAPSPQESDQSMEPGGETLENFGSHSSVKRSLSFYEEPSIELPTNSTKKFCSVFVNEDGTADEYEVAGKKYAFDLRALSDQQRIICEKIVSDAIYYGKLGRLTEESCINLYSNVDVKNIISTDT